MNGDHREATCARGRPAEWFVARERRLILNIDLTETAERRPQSRRRRGRAAPTRSRPPRARRRARRATRPPPRGRRRARASRRGSAASRRSLSSAAAERNKERWSTRAVEVSLVRLLYAPPGGGGDDAASGGGGRGTEARRQERTKGRTKRRETRQSDVPLVRSSAMSWYPR